MRILLLILILSTAARTQYLDGGTIARAGVNDLGFRSSRTAHVNPATLGLKLNRRTTLEFASLHFSAGNNAFDVNFWNDQIARDHYLTVDDKREILSRIPDKLRIQAGLSAPLLGFTYRQIGGSLTMESALSAQAPEEIFELALYGNQLDHLYELSDFDGEQYSMLNAAVAFAYEFQQEWIPAIYGGIGFHFYRGTNFERIATASGELLVTDSLITGFSIVQRVHSTRGDGVGFDLGGLAVLNDRWQLGVALRQIGSRLTWDIHENELLVWSADSAGIIIDSLDDNDYLERVFSSSDTSFPGGSYESNLPTIVQLDGRYETNRYTTLMGSLMIRTESSSQGNAGVEAALASELRPRKWLPLQLGISVGGPASWQVGVGGGLRFRNYELALGWSWSGGFFNKARGISFGLSQQLRF